MIIYKATNTANGKIYIGLTTLSLERRKIEHFWKANSSNKPYHFYNAIRKYGWNAFS